MRGRLRAEKIRYFLKGLLLEEKYAPLASCKEFNLEEVLLTFLAGNWELSPFMVKNLLEDKDNDSKGERYVVEIMGLPHESNIPTQNILKLEDQLLLEAITRDEYMDKKKNEKIEYLPVFFHAGGKEHKNDPAFLISPGDLLKDVLRVFFSLRADRVYKIDLFNTIPRMLDRKDILEVFAKRVDDARIIKLISSFLYNKYEYKDGEDLTQYYEEGLPPIKSKLYDLLVNLCMRDFFDCPFVEEYPNYTIFRIQTEVFVFLERSEIEKFELDINQFFYKYLTCDMSYTERGMPAITGFNDKAKFSLMDDRCLRATENV